MTVTIETTGALDRPTDAYETLLRARLGVEIKVALAAPGGLAEVTQIERRQKPIRLIDERQQGR